MSDLYTRRDALVAASYAFGVSVTSLLLNGCGNNTSTEPEVSAGDQGIATPEVDHSSPRTVSMSYADSDAFMDGLIAEIDKGNTVKVEFDGNTKLNKDSKLFQLMMNRERIQGYDELVESIRSNDTPEGRKVLAQIFEPALLEHEELSKPMTLPSGEVIEPGTIVIIALLLLVTAVVTTEVVRGRRIRSVRLGPGEILFEPVLA